MRATLQSESAQHSESREPTPKPSLRAALSVALNKMPLHNDNTSSSEPNSFDHHLIYDTSTPLLRPVNIVRSSSEGSGRRQPFNADRNDSEDGKPKVLNDLSPSRLSTGTLSTPEDRSSLSPPYSTSSTSSTTAVSPSSYDPADRLKPPDAGVNSTGNATSSLSDSSISRSTSRSSFTDSSKADMPDSRSPPGTSSSDSGRPPLGARGRSHSQTSRRVQQPHPRSQPFVTPVLHYSGPTIPPDQASASSAPPFAHGPLTPHSYSSSSAPPYLNVGTPVPGGSYIGSTGPYTISPPPPVNMVPQGRPPYAYPHHPGMHAHDTSNVPMHPQNPALLGYSSNTLVPMMQSAYSNYTPVPHPAPHGHSPEGSSTSSHGYTSPATAGGPHQPQGPSSPYSSQPPSSTPGYTSSRFPTPPYTPYPSHAYGHTGSMYPASYSTYAPTSYTPVPMDGPDNQGTWWYMPPVTRAPTTGGYEGYSAHTAYYPPNPLAMSDLEAAAVAAQGGYPTASSMGSSLYPASSQSPQSAQSPMQLPSMSPLSPSYLQSLSSPSIPPPSSSSDASPHPQPPLRGMVTRPEFSGRPPQAGTASTVPAAVAGGGGGSGGGNTERNTGRRPYHPNPPAHRSEWVMWAGNVPSDATHDELWRFFNQPPSPSAESIASSSGTSSSGKPTSVKSNPNPPTSAFRFGGGHGRGASFGGPYPSGPATSSSSSGGASGPAALQSQVPTQDSQLLFGGVQSIFFISRSNCAFINFESAEHLHAAIRHFNGIPLRPSDPRCPRLVCRVRGKEDDLKAGVGAQRGSGIHTKWIKDQKDKERLVTSMSLTPASGSRVVAGGGRGSPAERRSFSSSSEAFSPVSSPGNNPVASPNDDDSVLRSVQRGFPYGRGKPAPHSSSSGSMSTNSSILQQYFPKRYFILKSLTQEDLDLSVQKGLWATQKHNEGVLDQAYRTSKDVYLIFSVNKSGEFYGYARMASPILRGEHRVSWASRPDLSASRPGSTQSQRSLDPDSPRSPQPFFSPSEHRLYDQSPMPFTPDTSKPAEASSSTPASAPAELGRPHHRLSKRSPAVPASSFDAVKLKPVLPALLKQDSSFELNENAPVQAAMERSSPSAPLPGLGSAGPITDDEGVKRWDMITESLPIVHEGDESSLEPPTESESEFESKGKDRAVEEQLDPARGDGPTWGESFKVEWIRTERLPFYRTRNLRNPWNHDREVKVSRDGTELEPSVGQALLDEWDKPDTAFQQSVPSTSERRPAGTKTVSESVIAPVASQSSGRGRGR